MSLNKAMFSGVKYHLSPSFSSELQSHLTHALEKNGATHVPIHLATHIVTNSSQFEGWQSVQDGVVVVTDKWVTRSIQANKLQPPGYYSADPSLIFSGVVACATELPTSDVNVLSAGITALGGQWRSSLTRDVTHLFAISPGSKKYETAFHFQEMTKVKVILPHWFDDAVRLGTGTLPTTEYEWPETRVLRVAQDIEGEEIKRSKTVGAKKTLFKTAIWTPGQDLPTSTTKKRDIWEGRIVLLGRSLELTGGRREAVEGSIRRANGVVLEYDGDGDEKEEVEKVKEADVFITRYRAGAAYVQAFKEDKTIGTLAWLFHVDATGVLSRPMDQLLHFPIPKRPIEGFTAHEITVTNYTGESREYLKKLILSMGAQFTPSMSGRNTVLIAAYASGNKATKARNWSIPIVNHLWLEDCFIQWRNLTVALEKYIVFPPGIDFSLMLGERGVGKVALEDIDVVGHTDEVAPPLSAPRGTHRGKPYSGTNDSANEEEEVEDVVGLLDDDTALFTAPRDDPPDDQTDLDDRAEKLRKPKSKSKSKSPSKTVGRRPRPDSKGDSAKEKHTTPRRNKSSSPKKRIRDLDSDEDQEDVPRTKPVRKVVRRSVTPEIEHLRRKGGRAVLSESENEPGPSTRTRRKARVASDDDDDDERNHSPTRASRRANDVKRAKARAIQQLTDTEDEDLPPPISALTNIFPRGALASPKRGKAKNIVEATPSVPSPTRSGHSPKRVPSVVIMTTPQRDKQQASSPTIRKTHASPTRTDSLRIAAAEIPEVTITPKRGRPATENVFPSPPRALDRSYRMPQALVRTPSKRTAATKANQRLHDEVMPDLIHFQQEMRNKWRRKGKERVYDRSDDLPDRNGKGRGRISTSDYYTASPSGEEEESEESEEEERKVEKGGRNKKNPTRTDDSDEDIKRSRTKRKRRVSTAEPTTDDEGPRKQPRKSVSTSKPTGETKKANAPAKTVKLMTTQVTLPDETIKALTKLGVKVTTKPSECTHLIASHLVRTEKFLCALAVAPFILNELWAVHSAGAKTLLPEDNYVLQDAENEKKYGVKLSDAIRRAKRSRGKLFANKMFYVTPKVPVDVKLLKNIVIAGGGQVSTQPPTLRVLNANKNRHVISCPADASVWRPLAEHYPIYTQELLLTSALRHDIDWEDEEYRVPGSVGN